MLTDILPSSGSALSLIPNLNAHTFGASGIGNTAGALTTLETISIPAGTLSNLNDFMEFEYFGLLHGDADSNIQITLGGGDIWAAGSFDPGADEGFVLRGTLIRVSAQSLYGEVTLLSSTIQLCQLPAVSIDPTVANALVFKGGGTSANNILLVAAFRKFFLFNR